MSNYTKGPWEAMQVIGVAATIAWLRRERSWGSTQESRGAVMNIYDRDGSLHQVEQERRNLWRGIKFGAVLTVGLFTVTWIAFIAIGVWQNGAK